MSSICYISKSKNYHRDISGSRKLITAASENSVIKHAIFYYIKFYAFFICDQYAAWINIYRAVLAMISAVNNKQHAAVQPANFYLNFLVTVAIVNELRRCRPKSICILDCCNHPKKINYRTSQSQVDLSSCLQLKYAYFSKK